MARRAAKTVAIYGKGGGGKSTVSANLSVHFAQKGLRALQVGCDPKRDSTRALLGGRRIVSVMEVLREHRERGLQDFSKGEVLVEGVGGVGCIEAGGPESGIGCAGLGIAAAFRFLRKQRLMEEYDVVLMDVLGDVVCGGFATPMMRGVAGAVAIVLSASPLSMYAANNIAKAVCRLSRNGAYLAGLIANNVVDQSRVTDIEAFAEALGTQVIAVIPHDQAVLEAERQGSPVSLLDPEGALSAIYARLGDTLLETESQQCALPSPMSDDDLDDFLRQGLA